MSHSDVRFAALWTPMPGHVTRPERAPKKVKQLAKKAKREQRLRDAAETIKYERPR